MSLNNTSRENCINQYKVVENNYPNIEVSLLERIRLFCYDYLDSFERLEKPVLPHREDFNSNHSSEECSLADYAHAQHVWTEFNCQTDQDDLSLYLISDICLLADAFEKFRNNSLEEYQLDPAYYVSAP